MFAIAARPGSTEPYLVDIPEPTAPPGGSVLCRTLQLGVCGTDRDILLKSQPLTPPGEDFLVLGHECLAKIEAVGEGVERLQPGDLVVPVVRRPTDDRAPRPDLLPFGQYVERGIVHEHGFAAPLWLDRPQYLHKVPNEIRSVAVLAEPMSVAEKGVNEAVAIQRGRLGASAWCEPVPRVLVTGMGPIAFAALVACHCRGWPVVLYGRDPVDSPRAQTAQGLGANYIPADEFEAAPQNVERDGFDLILECTGSASVMVNLAPSLASCGVLVWLGSSHTHRAENLQIERLMRHGLLRNHVHVGSVNAAPRDFQQALLDLRQCWQTHAELLDSLVTKRVAPEESLPHYRDREPQSIKTVLMFE